MKDHLHRVTEPRKLGALLRSRRIEVGLDQAALSEICGITQANISRMERGLLDARLGTYLALAESLGVDLFAMKRE